MPEVSEESWSDFIQDQVNPHLLQTPQWGKLKSAFGWDVSRLITGNTGAQILFRRLPLGFSLAYIPRGPVGDDWSRLWHEADTICKQRGAVLLKIEPDLWVDGNSDAPIPPAGFVNSTHSIQPMRTLIISLDGTEDQILGGMKQKTRYNISLASRKDVEVFPSADVRLFSRLVIETGVRSGFGVHTQPYYQLAYDLFHRDGRCELFLAKYRGDVLAGLMVFRQGGRAWYLYGGSSERERNRMPAYLLQWEAIRWARQNGCVEYDLWGVPDEDEAVLETEFTSKNDGLWGVYRFKRGFGGRLTRSAGPWDKVYRPALYRLYRWFVERRSS